jgi:hypothetical protein
VSLPVNTDIAVLRHHGANTPSNEINLNPAVGWFILNLCCGGTYKGSIRARRSSGPARPYIARFRVLRSSGANSGSGAYSRQISPAMELTSMLSIDDLFKGRHFDREIIILCVR